MALKPKRPAHGIAIEGMQELINTLTGVLPKEAHNLARGTVHAVAGQVRNSMRSHAPKDTGELRKAIVSVRRRGTPTQAVSDVIVMHGRSQKYDAWYWRFQEFGTQHHAAQPFITPTVEEMRPKIPGIFRKEWGKRLERLMAKKAKTK